MRPRTIARFAPRTAACVAVLALVTVGLASEAQAQGHLIGPDQEPRVLALFAPHELTHEVGDGFALWNVAIERRYIEITLRKNGTLDTTLTLRHRDDADDDAIETRSFAVTMGGLQTPDARRARRSILSALRRNDDGTFWEEAGDAIQISPHSSPSSRLVRGLRQVMGDWVPADSHALVRWTQTGWVPVDGMAVILLVFLLGVVLAVRLLIDAPRWMGPALGATVVAGAVVRLMLAPATFLGSWPWSRLYPNVREVAHGQWLASLAELSGQTFFLTDVSMWTNYAYAVAMPLVFFSHATYLLRDPKAGLGAAFAIAFLPQHIRYSRCEDGFVASLVLTSLAFALIHGFLRDPSRKVRWFLLAALPVVLYPGYLLRPLNILFVVVYVAAILVLHPSSAPRKRRGIALGVVGLVGALAGVQFLGVNGDAVGVAASSVEWIGSALWVLVSPTLLVLSDPTRTPPVLIVLAVVGGVLLYRSGERRLLGFLCAWLLMFVVVHAYVVQESMQPRYHLHLVVPFLLLAAAAVPRIPKRFERALWVCGPILLVSPWVHGHFVQDVDYAEQHEYEFVRRARAMVPEGCSVLEFTGSPREVDELRFSRIGALANRDRGQRFRAIGVFPDGETGPGQPSLASIFQEPPRCLYLYEGLACSSHRARGETYSGHCTALRERLQAETVLEDRVPARYYDNANAGRTDPRPSEVPLRLSRVPVGPRPGAPREGGGARRDPHTRGPDDEATEPPEPPPESELENPE
ncbi:MAG: hypothetical protein AB8I08_26530 [Sandaracinaceae bacterium]